MYALLIVHSRYRMHSSVLKKAVAKTSGEFEIVVQQSSNNVAPSSLLADKGDTNKKDPNESDKP
jgi:hypothetical protein